MPPTALQPVKIRNLGIYGVIRQSEVDDSLIPDGAVPEAVNFHFDRKGAATVRSGMTALGSTVVVSTVPSGLVSTFNSSIVIFPSDGSAWYWNGSAWGLRGAAGSFASTAKIRYAEFLDRGIIVISASGAYDSLWILKYIGNAGSTDFSKTDTSPLNLQQFASDANINTQTLRAKFVETFKSRLYLSGDPTTPDRLFFSSVASSTGKITWTPSIDYVDINPNDGENITALKRFSLELLVFKPNYLYRFRTSGTDPDPLIKVGTRSQESIIEGKRGVYFHHDSGFYRYSGGYPEEIGRAISDVILAIPFSQFSGINGWKDTDHIYWSLGHLIINGETWKNVAVRYTESSDVWAIYSYPSDIRRAITYTSGSYQTIVVGLDNGVAATFNSGTTDIGEPIKYRIITKWHELEGISNSKIIQTMTAICEKAQGMNLMYQINDEIEWKSVGDGQIRKFLNIFKNLKIKLNRVRFKVTGVSRSEAPVFLGLEILEGINEGLL
mgnify:CR=1 FL=1